MQSRRQLFSSLTGASLFLPSYLVGLVRRLNQTPARPMQNPRLRGEHTLLEIHRRTGNGRSRPKQFCSLYRSRVVTILDLRRLLAHCRDGVFLYGCAIFSRLGIHESSACLTNPSRHVATFVLPVLFRLGRWRTSGIAGRASTVADLSDNLVWRNWVTRNAVVSAIDVTY